jgi:hypothetical protein
VVEHFLGKEEVPSSILGLGSISPLTFSPQLRWSVAARLTASLAATLLAALPPCWRLKLSGGPFGETTLVLDVNLGLGFFGFAAVLGFDFDPPGSWDSRSCVGDKEFL